MLCFLEQVSRCDSTLCHGFVSGVAVFSVWEQSIIEISCSVRDVLLVDTRVTVCVGLSCPTSLCENRVVSKYPKFLCTKCHIVLLEGKREDSVRFLEFSV